MSFNFFGNKRKVNTSKITFTEPTSLALKTKESLTTPPDESQQKKKQKTIDSNPNTFAAKTSNIATSSSTTNNLMETELIPSASKSTDWSDDAMTLDTGNIDKSGDFENLLSTLNKPVAEAISQNQSNTATGNGNSEDEQINEINFIQVSHLIKFFATIPAEKIDGN